MLNCSHTLQWPCLFKIMSNWLKLVLKNQALQSHVLGVFASVNSLDQSVGCHHGLVDFGCNVPFELTRSLCHHPTNCVLIVQGHYSHQRKGHNNKQETVKDEDQCSNFYCSNTEHGSESPIRFQKK